MNSSLPNARRQCETSKVGVTNAPLKYSLLNLSNDDLMKSVVTSIIVFVFIVFFYNAKIQRKIGITKLFILIKVNDTD